MTQAFRRDSIFFVHFFSGALVAAGALAFGLTAIEWCVLVFAFAAIIAAELVHQVVLEFASVHEDLPADSHRRMTRLAMALVMTAGAAAVITAAAIFAKHIYVAFSG
ncbi:diacylglycerol kinase [Stratiformator vulcanicus]|uniref:Prokaryotic diacylglycerol kinase n=1 Tax=Stratiformator vulcanicus TaxID=2527980 RepID=A0A517R6X9_9PLAN|nr:diacylglycerol kinase [Stratiformator vulcanicus]QDT39644.1 hypothetical protein Pan189_40530 [Stratiformator vulcanicus]